MDRRYITLIMIWVLQWGKRRRARRELAAQALEISITSRSDNRRQRLVRPPGALLGLGVRHVFKYRESEDLVFSGYLAARVQLAQTVKWRYSARERLS